MTDAVSAACLAPPQPDDALCLGNFAVYLHRIKKDVDAAGTTYRKVRTGLPACLVLRADS